MRSRTVLLGFFGSALVALLTLMAMSEQPNGGRSDPSSLPPAKDHAARAAELAEYESVLSEKRRQAEEIMKEGRPSPPKPAAKGTGQNSQNEQAAYARRLEQVLLSNGTSADVFIEPGPQLTIFMYLSKATVYQMIKDGHVLDNAFKLNFKRVRFHSKAGDSWFFDMSETMPVCDRTRRLCL
jgi:hypothetical protein